MSATVETSTRWIGMFVADWLTRDDCENMKGEPAACLDRLDQALRTAFPGVSEADFDRGIREMKAALDRSLLAG